MEFRVLGPLEIVDDGRERALAGAKERAVLACLLLEPDRVVAADDVLEAVWADVPRAVAARSLAVRLANLRGFLEPKRPRGARSTVLLHEAGGYRLAVDPDRVDAQRFGAHLKRAASAPPASALAACDEALSLWRGTPLPELADAPLARAELHRLRELRAQAVEWRMRALVDLGRHDAALAELRRLVAEEPWREELVRLLAVALYRVGRQVDALDAVRALAGELRELGLDASPETRALERQILEHDPVLAAPAGVPAPASPPSQPGPAGGRLPLRASRFIGREADLAQAAEPVARGPLVTISGVGGAGKTRLALELAERLSDRFAGARWWCELAPIERPDDVPGAVVDALGLDSAAGDPAVERVVERLAVGPSLLVLDNCEHVLDGVAGLVERLLAACPELRIVCTSRAPLGVDGEQVVRLAGLSVATGADDGEESPAAALFLDRAVAAAGLVHRASDLAAVEELCRRLDGLPLAIELAAGRSRSMTPHEIVAALDERFGLLVGAGRRGTARHATLRAAIDWSYGLLRDPQRRVFERLSVFHRGCTLSAARDVCAGDGVPRDAVHGILDELVAHSMLTAEAVRGKTRYRLLESLRDYAAERLRERGEEEAARDRHALHYAARVERALAERGSWRGPGLPHAREFDDVRAAIRWCAGRSPSPERAFLLLGALWTTAIDRHAEEIALLAEQILARHPEEAVTRLHALGTAATARMSLGDTVGAQAHASAAVALEERVGASALIARRVLCGIAYQAGDLPGALRLTQDLARRAREAGDEPLACETDGFTAQLHDAAGDTDEAIALAFEMRARADMLHAPFLASWSRYVSGVVTLERDREEAKRWFTQGLACARAASQPHMVRFNLRALGVVAILDGDFAEAAPRLAAALEQADGTANPATQWATLLAVVPLLAGMGRDTAAATLLAATAATPTAPLLGSLGVLGRLAARAERELAVRLGPERLADAAAHGRTLDLAAATDLAAGELVRLAVSGP